MDIHICMVLFCICVVTGETSFWVDTVDSAAYEPRTSEKPTSWWDAANHECAKSDGHLFVPREQDDKDRVVNLLDDQKVYWVGGFQYSYLKWTEDDTRYHTRVGYMNAGVVIPFTVRYNSAMRCDYRCGGNHQLYGLKGTSCFCLGSNLWRDGIIAGSTGRESNCGGTGGQYCGDGSVMSVYRKVRNNRYENIGYMYSGLVAPVTLQDNSAFSCDLRCGIKHRLYGLQGTSCYCLGQYAQAYSITERDRTEIRCPGDYDERCGDDSVMTVYKKDARFVPLSLYGKCGYVVKHVAKNGKEYAYFHLDDNCVKKRPYVCTADTDCSVHTCIPRTWGKAYRTCTLAKPTDSNIGNIQRDREYWIGLRRSVESNWINVLTGNPYASNSRSYYLDRRCLSVQRRGSMLLPSWHDCRLLRPALCNTVNRQSSPSIREHTSTIHPSTQVIRASTQVIQTSTQGSSSVTILSASTTEPAASTPTDTTPTSRQRTTSHDGKGFVHQETNKGEDQPSGFTATYIVGAASVLAVGIVITLVIVFFKRQRRFCFKLEDEREDGVHYDTVAESLSYTPADPGSQSATNEDACPCPERTVKKAHMSTKRSSTPYENLVSNNGSKQEESIYNIPDETSPAEPTRIGRGSQRKDTTSNPSDKGACLEEEDQYNYMNVNARAITAPGNRVQCVKDDADYYQRLKFPPAQPPETLYSRLGQSDFESSKPDGLVDISAQKAQS